MKIGAASCMESHARCKSLPSDRKKGERMNKLETCPFCGSGVFVVDKHHRVILCEGCRLIFQFPFGMTEDKMIELWNRRTT